MTQTIYRLKRQVLIAIAVIALSIIAVYAQPATPSTVPVEARSWVDKLLEPQNLVALCLVIFHLGGVAAQFADFRKRVSELERWRTEDLDGVYARKETVIAQLGRRADDRTWHDHDRQDR